MKKEQTGRGGDGVTRRPRADNVAAFSPSLRHPFSPSFFILYHAVHVEEDAGGVVARVAARVEACGGLAGAAAFCGDGGGGGVRPGRGGAACPGPASVGGRVGGCRG